MIKLLAQSTGSLAVGISSSPNTQMRKLRRNKVRAENDRIHIWVHWSGDVPLCNMLPCRKDCFTASAKIMLDIFH
jgi:hypothetical protein